MPRQPTQPVQVAQNAGYENPDAFSTYDAPVYLDIDRSMPLPPPQRSNEDQQYLDTYNKNKDEMEAVHKEIDETDDAIQAMQKKMDKMTRADPDYAEMYKQWTALHDKMGAALKRHQALMSQFAPGALNAQERRGEQLMNIPGDVETMRKAIENRQKQERPPTAPPKRDITNVPIS
jgi:hypothetical protein